jgi:hypothetical protein
MLTDSEKLRIARELDVDAALAGSPYTPPGGYKDTGEYAGQRETVLAGLHRARIMQPRHFSKEERRLSKQWLFDNGWRVSP